MQQLQLFCEAIVNVFEAIAIVLQSNCNCFAKQLRVLQSNCNCFAKQLQLFCEAIAIVLQSNCNCFAKNCNCFAKQLLRLMGHLNSYKKIFQSRARDSIRHYVGPSICWFVYSFLAVWSWKESRISVLPLARWYTAPAQMLYSACSPASNWCCHVYGLVRW